MLGNLKISTRLEIMLAFFLLGLVIVGAAGLYASNKLSKSMRSIYDDRMIPTLHLYTIHTANLNNALAISKAIADPENMQQYIREIESNKALIDSEWEKYTTILERDPKDLDEDKLLTGMFVQARKRFFEEGIKPAVAAMNANDLAETQRLHREIVLPLTFPLYESLGTLIDMEAHEATLAHQAGEALAAKIRLISIITILSSLIAGGALSFSIARSINRSVNELNKIIGRMTDDDNTSERAHVYGKDEIGKITGEFNTLLDRINNLSELKRVFDKLEEGVVFIDRQRRVTAINKAACKLLGQDEGAALNKLCPDLFRGMDCAKECKQYDHCRRMADAQLEGKFQETSIQRPDDAIIGLHLSAIDLPSKGSLVFRGTDW